MRQVIPKQLTQMSHPVHVELRDHKVSIEAIYNMPLHRIDLLLFFVFVPKFPTAKRW